MEVDHLDEGEFAKWFRRLGAIEQAKTAWELDLLAGAEGLLGMPHVRDLGAGLLELRVRVGQHPRLYFELRAGTIHMLTYGRKDTQRRDIDRARGRMT